MGETEAIEAPLPADAAGDEAWKIADANWRTLRDTPLSRRWFVTGAVLGAGGLIAAATASLGVLTIISPLRRKDVRSERNDLGPIIAFPVGYYVKQRLSYHGAPTQQVAQRAAYVRRNADGFVDPMTGQRDEFTILWNRCAHLGCPVSYEGFEFVCPCHGGVYDAEGRRIAGPPLHSLDRFHYRVESGHLVVYGAYSLYPTGKHAANGRKLYAPGQLRTPGEATQGVEGAWYPLQNGEDQ